MELTFKAEENQDTGLLGWQDSRIRGSDIYEPFSEPLGLTHDTLEHFGFESVADEIEAHAAMYLYRYVGGWYDEYGNSLSLDVIASEWDNLLRALVREPYMPKAPECEPLDDEIEEEISFIIEQGKAYCEQNVIPGYFDEEDIRSELERLASVFRAFFRQGYRKAQLRMGSEHPHDMAHLFKVVYDAFKRQRNPEFEGQKIIVRIDVENCEVSIEEVDLYAEEE